MQYGGHYGGGGGMHTPGGYGGQQGGMGTPLSGGGFGGGRGGIGASGGLGGMGGMDGAGGVPTPYPTLLFQSPAPGGNGASPALGTAGFYTSGKARSLTAL
jgi:hypothetical protein